MTQEETIALAWDENCNKGHFHRDGIKNQLLDKIVTPKTDQSIMRTIMDCCRCKEFGSTHLHSLLKPVTRHHPF